MSNEKLKQILESPITKAAKGRFMSIEELEQIEIILEAWESVEPHLVDLGDVYVLAICNDDKEYLTLKKALEKYDEKED